MNKVKLLKYVNPVLFLVILAQFVLLFLSEKIEISWYSDFHHYNGYAIGLLAVMHIYLNMSWFRNTYFKKKKRTATTVEINRAHQKQGAHTASNQQDPSI